MESVLQKKMTTTSSTNLIWLIFDSIRGDRTSIGGYHRDTTPVLRQIGSRSDGLAGTCFSHGIWSQPSVASMMTGTYPATHGAGGRNEVLPKELPTVASRLSDAGFQTRGLSVNPYFSPTTGMDKGFDDFEYFTIKDLLQSAGVRGLYSFLKNIRKYSGGLTIEKRKHSPDYLFNEIVKERIGRIKDTDNPTFIAAHYNGLHHAYYPSPTYRDRFADDLHKTPGEAADSVFNHTKDVFSEIAQGGPDPELREAIDAMYDAQILQTDHLIGDLVSHIDRSLPDEDTIVVITSDHGDLLGENDLLAHKLLLHDALINVPVAIYGSEQLAKLDLTMSQHIDIMQSILTHLDINTDGMQGIDLSEQSRTYAFAQRGSATTQKTLEEIRKYNTEFQHEDVLEGFVTAVRTNDWKYVTNGSEQKLYKIPDEDEDVSQQHEDIVNDLDSVLKEWSEKHSQIMHSDEQSEFDPEVKEHLADLGYIVD